MSPADKAYLDMKYDATTQLGLHWAGYTSVRDAYAWDPARTVAGVTGDGGARGRGAALVARRRRPSPTSSTSRSRALIGIAEIGWSPARGRSWAEYRVRLGAQGPRLTAMGVGFYRSPEVPWR